MACQTLLGWLSSQSHRPPVPQSSRHTDDMQQQHSVACTLASGGILLLSAALWSLICLAHPSCRGERPSHPARSSRFEEPDLGRERLSFAQPCRRPWTASLTGNRGDGQSRGSEENIIDSAVPKSHGLPDPPEPLSRRPARPAFPVRWALGITKHAPWASSPFRQPWSETIYVIPAGTWPRD